MNDTPSSDCTCPKDPDGQRQRVPGTNPVQRCIASNCPQHKHLIPAKGPDYDRPRRSKKLVKEYNR